MNSSYVGHTYIWTSKIIDTRVVELNTDFNIVILSSYKYKFKGWFYSKSKIKAH